MAEKPIKIGTRVEAKGVLGSVAYIGTTHFTAGKWIGIILDEPKGKNNGMVQGKRYFTCDDNHGIFIRQSQLTILDEETSGSAKNSRSSTPTPQDSTSRVLGTPRTGIPHAGSRVTPGSGLPTPRGPSRTSSTEDLGKTKRLSGLRPPSGGRIAPIRSLYRSGTENVASTPKTSKASPAPAPAVEKEKAAPVTAAVAVTPAKVEKPQPAPETPTSQGMAQSMSQSMTQSMTQSISEKMEAFQNQQELDNLRGEVRDLEEKLETLKVKRADDKAKLMEFEKVKIQLQSLQEYKLRQQEAMTDLQRQLQAAKKETREIHEAYDRYREEMSDLAETVEIATLDKEMAEEKCESLQQEVDSLKEKVDELNVDINIMKEEMASAPTDGAANNYQVKQLEQQNERLREAVVKMRDLSNHEKQESARATKELDKLKSDLQNLLKDKEKMTSEVNELQNQVIELKEQVDAAQGAEEMVEQLTEKTLQQEEQMQNLLEEKSDLEALCEMNDELAENLRETELELREEIDLANGRAAEAYRKMEAFQENIADYEKTISKFRELVAQLQESNRELRSKQETGGESKAETPSIEMFDFKAKFAETKAHAKAIDMELRKLDVQQANRHVAYLCSFMPESFLRRGGDHDAVLVLLLIPRLISKIELLISQVREKFEVPENLEQDDVLKTHKSDAFSFANSFTHALCILQSALKQYESALDTCSVEVLLKVGTLLPEIAVHEKSIDFFIELLRKDQLDENISREPLEKCIAYFQTLYDVHLSHEKVDCTMLMADQVRVLLAANDCLNIDTSRLKLALLPGQETSDVSILLKDLESQNNDIRLSCRKIKRRIPQQEGVTTAPLTFGKEVQEDLAKCIEEINKVVRTLQETALASMKQAALITGEDTDAGSEGKGLQSKKLEEFAFNATDTVYAHTSATPYNVLREACTKISGVVKKIAVAMENGEYDFDGTQEKRPMPPVMVRAMGVKQQMSDTENLKIRLENKEEQIKELKTQLKMKQEELSEQQVRISLIERKLDNSGKDADDRVEKFRAKLDEANQELQRKTKEFEETMDALQGDIDALEAERAELKEKLKMLSKKTLLEGLTRQTGSSVLASAAAAGGTLTIKDSPLLLEQIEALKEALRSVKDENVRLRSQKMKEQMTRLRPIKVPKRLPKTGSEVIPTEGAGDNEQSKKPKDLTGLTKDTNKLLNDLYKMCATPRVVDISKRKAGVTPATESAAPYHQLINNSVRVYQMQKSANELQVAVTNLMAANRQGGQVRTDFSAFPTPSFAKMLHEKQVGSQCVGQVSIPAEPGKGNIIPISVSPSQLKVIHARFVV